MLSANCSFNPNPSKCTERAEEREKTHEGKIKNSMKDQAQDKFSYFGDLLDTPTRISAEREARGERRECESVLLNRTVIQFFGLRHLE